MEALFLLLVGHAVCDFVLQPEAMGLGKSRRRNVRVDRGADFPPWYVWLTAHSLTHGGAVYLVSGSWELGALESLLHAGIDHLKCEERITFHQDQALHIACKIVYAFALL